LELDTILGKNSSLPRERTLLQVDKREDDRQQQNRANSEDQPQYRTNYDSENKWNPRNRIARYWEAMTATDIAV